MTELEQAIEKATMEVFGAPWANRSSRSIVQHFLAAMRGAGFRFERDWMPIESLSKDEKTLSGTNYYGPWVLGYPIGAPSVCRWWECAPSAGSDWERYRKFISAGGFACYPTHFKPLPEGPTK